MTDLGAGFSEGRILMTKDTSTTVYDGEGMRIDLTKHFGVESLVINLGDMVLRISGRSAKKMRENLEEKGII